MRQPRQHDGLGRHAAGGEERRRFDGATRPLGQLVLLRGHEQDRGRGQDLIERGARPHVTVALRRPQVDLALERESAVRLRALTGADAGDAVLEEVRSHGHRASLRRARCGHLGDDGFHTTVNRRHRRDHAAAVARTPDADALGVHARLALQERDGRAEVIHFVRVVQVRALQQDAQFVLGHHHIVFRRVGLEQPDVVGAAAAEAVALIVDGHATSPRSANRAANFSMPMESALMPWPTTTAGYFALA